MSQSRKVAWRKAVVVGWLAASGAVFPLLATAQQNAEQLVPSGAAVEVGGVQARPAAAQGVQTGPVAVEGGQTAPGNVSGAQPQTIEVGGAQARPVGVGGAQTRPVEVAGAQSRPIVLPNTGGGPENALGLLPLGLAGGAGGLLTLLGVRRARSRKTG